MTASSSGAWVLDTFANLWTGAPPTMAGLVGKGENRRFYAIYFAEGIRSINTDEWTDPILTGPRGSAFTQVHTGSYQSSSNRTEDSVVLVWYWDDAALVAAGCPIGADAAVTISDIAAEPDPTFGTVDEELWGYGTLRDVEQIEGVKFGNSAEASSFSMPNSAFPSEPDSLTQLHLAALVIQNASITITSIPGFTELGQVTGSNANYYIYAGEFAGDAAQVTVTLSGTATGILAAVIRNYSHPLSTGGLVGVTIGVRPRMRSIDAKTLADNYNKGQPKKPDYTWPGGRKFYQ